MAFMDHIIACNQHDPDRYIPFLVNGLVVGMVFPEFARQATALSGLLQVTEAGLHYTAPDGNLEQRSEEFSALLAEFVAAGLISHHHGEPYVATPSGREQGVLLVDRAAVPYLGVRAFGQHINGYVHTPTGLKMWIGRRSADRKNFPGALDNLAAGGLPYNISLADNLRKECWEEASIPARLAATARPVGAITYCTDMAKGCKPDTMYCYDIELKEDFLPRCQDGEVEAFFLMPVEEVYDRVKYSQDFKLNCNLVIIDFLIRHGYIGPDEPDYLDLIRTLHRELPSYSTGVLNS